MAGEQLVRVGDEPVCPACLILRFAVTRGKATEDAQCLVCETRLEARRSVEFFGRRICSACVNQMNKELAAGDARDRRLERDARALNDEVADEAAVAHRGREPQRFTPGAGSVACDGCERPMPGPGSFRLLEGRRYCPACYLVASRRAPPGTTPETASGRAPACACCDAGLTHPPPLRQGFLLCDACVYADEQLALKVAQARHRRRMRQLGLEPRGEDDDG